MVLTVNSLGAWHSGLKGNVPHGHYDLVTVVIHELQHGLGFLSMVGQGNSLNGIESFSKGVQGEAYIFDRFVHVVGQGHIFSAPSVAQNRGLINTTISLVWESPSFTEENKPKLYVGLQVESRCPLPAAHTTRRTRHTTHADMCRRRLKAAAAFRTWTRRRTRPARRRPS